MVSPVSGLILVIRSTVSPQSSMRTARSSYAGKISTVSPRTRKVPGSKLTSFRLYWMATRASRMESRPRSLPCSTVTIWARYSTGSPRP